MQQHELSIVREYERKILALETEELTRALSQTTDFSSHLGRVCELLRSVMRVLGGEDPSIVPPPSDSQPSEPNAFVTIRDRHIVNSLEVNDDGSEEQIVSDRERQLAAAEYALERESELARLEQENAFLRQLAAEHFQLEQSAQKPASIPELPKLSNLPKSAARTMKEKLGGKDIGPFGKWKKFGED